MTLLAFKQNLYTTLKSHYPKTELDSFFKIILEDVLQLSKIDFALNPHQTINKEQASHLCKIIDELANHRPIQHLIGFTQFMDLKLKVNQHVLIPRPETEELIRWILDDFGQQEELEVLDIGTGTGCIAIALAKHLKNAQVSSIDVSEKAIEIAKSNGKTNHANIQFIHQDILKTKALTKSYDIIVSNPPYVRNLEKVEIQKNVLDYEPHLALFVDDDNPLVFYKKIAELAKTALKPNGILYYEINQYLGKETADLLKKLDFKHAELKKDIFRNDRMVKAVFR